MRTLILTDPAVHPVRRIRDHHVYASVTDAAGDLYVAAGPGN